MADYEVQRAFKWQGKLVQPGTRMSRDHIERTGAGKADSMRRLGMIAEVQPVRRSPSKKKGQ